ncbi:MAG: hypothetical protein CVU71_10615 [Deltaproteobacteria bacterium HGW-Deltaproteobacteria-6]|jgi:dTDP-4-dehydrorhamnose reductase|nr:MAG: hypothetical protein CVU71_10615 [Deltaproteobacteria bacterium HGW-Deltaproteobacteria-6]
MTASSSIIFGGDGQLGANLATLLKERGRPVLSTIFLKDQPARDEIYLDISKDMSRWPVPGKFADAFFCAAITSTEVCRTQPDVCRKVNVENTLALARLLSETGAALFFPSTNLVFDGSIPFRKSTDATNPQCEYGRQKVATEQGLAALTDKAAVIRFSKIIGPGMTLLTNWANDLRNGTTIHPFSDMVLAPVSLRFATEIILAVMQKKSYGIWQVSAAEDVTYEEMARHLARKIGAPQSLIAPVKACESGLTMETIPEHTTLDASRLKGELNITAPSVWDTLDEVII